MRAGLAVAIILSSRAEATRAQSLPPLDEYRIRVFGAAHGLPHSAVQGITQTRDHHLIVATVLGLVRFDGYRFERIATPGLPDIHWIHKDREDRIWVRSWGNRLGVLEGDAFRLLPAPPGYPSGADRVPAMDWVRGAWLTRDGWIWFGGTHGLLRTAAGAPDEFTRYTMADGLPSDTVLGVFDLSATERVAITRHRLAAVVKDASRPGGLRFEPFGPPCRITADPVVRGSLIRLTCGGDRGNYLLDYADGRFVRPAGALRSPDPPSADDDAAETLPPGGVDRTHSPYFAVSDPAAGAPDHRPYFGNVNWHVGLSARALGIPLPDEPLSGIILDARDGTRWRTVRAAVPTDYLVRERAGIAQWIRLRRTHEFSQIYDLFEDHEGNLWIGTDRGLVELTERVASTMDARDGLADGFTTAILETRDGAVWIGTWGAGLHRYADGRLAARYTTDNGLPDDRIRGLYQAHDGTLWIGTFLGPAAIRDGRLTASPPRPNETRAFAEAAGRLWIATEDGLLTLPAGGSDIEAADTVLAGPQWALHTAADGTLWAGGERGLYRFADGRLARFGEADGTAGWFVAMIREDADGALWFGTFAHGLARYSDGRFVSITSRDGLPADGVWAMLEDSSGGVWLSGNAGITRIAKADLRSLLDARQRGNDPGRLTPLVFTEAEGLPDRESNRASPAATRLRGGRLVFNNLRGAVVVDPARVSGPPPPVTSLQRVVADGEPVDVRPGTGRPVVPSGSRQLLFDFVALAFASPEQSRYRFRLVGYDRDWVDGGSVRRASYTGLHPGRYTFRVQSANGNSDWGDVTEWSFAMPPLLWQALWFRVLALTGIGALIVVAYRYRVRKLLEMERMRVRIASDLHDDLGANLSSIALLSQMLEGHSSLGERERSQLTRIGSAARETMSGLRDVIWLVDPKHDNLPALLDRMRTTASGLLDGTRWTVHAPQTLPERRLGMSLVRNTFLVYKEALNNAVRHSRAGCVDISVSVDGGRLRVLIEDDGRGFDPDAAGGGNGLGNMRRRAEEIGGTVEVSSSPGRGTRIVFTASIAGT